MKKNGLRFFVFAIMITAILVALLAIKPIVRADTEPNNDFAHAELITAGNHTGSLDYTGDTDTDDYYKITVSAGQTLSVNATPASTLGIYLYFYRADHSQVVSDYPSTGLPAVASWTTNSEQASYTYYIQLHASDGSGTYTMAVSLTSQNDGNSGGDAGDDFAPATKIASANASYAGFLKDDDVDDYYKIVISAGQTLSLNVTPIPSLGIYLNLYRADHSQVASDYPNTGVPATLSWTTNSLSVNYTYYIRVHLWTAYGNYTTEISITSQNDANSRGDAGDNFAKATPVSTGTYFGFLKDDDTDDYYKTTQNVTMGQGLYVTVTPSPNLGIGVTLYDQAHVSRAYNSSNAGVPVIVGARSLTTQPLYIDVHMREAYGNYTMKIIQEPIVGTPTRTPQTPNPGQSVKVSVSVTAPQEGVGNVKLSYRTNQSVTWVDITMNKNSTTGLYEGTIPGFSATTNVTYEITGYNTPGDYFVQDNSALYYSYTVIPEFSSITLLLGIFCISAVLAVLYRHRKAARIDSLLH